jgi:DNA mismatch endonuclease (patch repair protein)
MDIVDRTKRSQMMSRIGPRDTRPEIAVRRVAHRLGLRFRLHRKDLPGKPDMVLPKYRIAIFVHGCFWHRHSECTNCTTPKTRAEFWREKFARNIARDERNMRDLRTLGWLPVVIWECETEDELAVQRRLLQIRRKACRRGSPSVVRKHG